MARLYRRMSSRRVFTPILCMPVRGRHLAEDATVPSVAKIKKPLEEILTLAE